MIVARQKRKSYKTEMTQSQRDQVETEMRLRFSGPLFPIMEERLRPFPKDILRDAAKSVCQSRGMIKPDRLCVRARVALICYFCKWFPDFPAGFPMFSLPTGPILPIQDQSQATPAVSRPAPEPADNLLFLVDQLFPEDDGAMTRESLWQRDVDFTNFFH
jgi:hypothetical protein